MIGTAITASDYVTYIFCVTKGFSRKFCEEDGELCVGWHLLHVNDYGVKVVGLWIALDNCDQAGGIWEERFDARREERELDNQGGIGGCQHFVAGATCPGMPNCGVRNVGPVVGKVGAPPLVVVVLVGVGVPDENGPVQAVRRRVRA